MSAPLSPPRAIISRLFRSPVLWVFVVTVTALAIHPIPECLDCEGPNLWGRNEIAYRHAADMFTVWLLVISVIAGFCSVRKYWFVPLSIVLADLITQPLGGVPLWSLRSNEGPVISVLGFTVGTASLLFGALLKFAFNRIMERHSKA